MHKRPLGDKIFSKTTTVQENGFEKTTYTMFFSPEKKKHLPPKKSILLDSSGNQIIVILWISTKPNNCRQPPNLSQAVDDTFAPKYMLQMLEFSACHHSLPLDIIKLNAQNILRSNLMSSKTMMTMMITYLLMQITTCPENADSSINQ